MSRKGRACLAEAVGTSGLIFVGAGAIILDAKTGGGVDDAHGAVLGVAAYRALRSVDRDLLVVHTPPG